MHDSDEASGKGPLTVIKQLGGKARAFNRCVRKAEGHLKRLGDENDRERSVCWSATDEECAGVIYCMCKPVCCKEQ